MGGGCAMGGCGYGGMAMGYAGGGSMMAFADGVPMMAFADGLTATEATLVVDLPADATLTVDGNATTSTSASRLFVTPALETGKTFHYTLTAQVVRDGNVQTVTRQVAVRAGETTRDQLDLPVAAVASR
jgi:uncharacterized protein (TIGR03000 family)